MDIRNFLDQVGGDYDEVMSRLMKEDRILKYVSRFPDSEDYPLLLESLEKCDWESAFRASHTIKGVCLNLGLGKLGKSSSELCETMRNGAPTTDITPLIEKVKEDYAFTVEKIKELN